MGAKNKDRGVNSVETETKKTAVLQSSVKYYISNDVKMDL